MLVNLNDVLVKARKEKYAVGLFNTIDSDMLDAAIEAAEELNSPIIIGTAEVLLPYGEISLIAPSIISKAKQAKVPVVVHFDHGLSFERCIEAMKYGFSSIMYDASSKPLKVNIRETCEIIKIAHALGISVEGEIGHIGSEIGDAIQLENVYTTLSEAIEYFEQTNVDALAVAIGSAHGVYKQKPKLNIERLNEISKTVNVPLVLHGGSGLSDVDFRTLIENGVSKINIFTDLCIQGESALKEGISRGLNYLEIRNLKKNRIKNVVKEKMRLFGSVNKG